MRSEDIRGAQGYFKTACLISVIKQLWYVILACSDKPNDLANKFILKLKTWPQFKWGMYRMILRKVLKLMQSSKINVRLIY